MNLFTMSLESKWEQKNELHDGIGFIYKGIQNDFTVFSEENIRFRQIGSLNNSNIIMNNTLWVGIYPSVTHEELDHIAESLEKYFSSISV